jgi:photosystem II stability/assembly factor-like uncharacterized protein
MKFRNFLLLLLFFSGLIEINAQIHFRTWASRYNGVGNGRDDISDMAVDNWGNVIVTGRSDRTASNYEFEITTIKYSPNGSLQWIRKYPQGGDGNAIVTDAAGNIYVTGVLSGIYSYCVTIKYSPSGDQLWARQYDAGLWTSSLGNAIALDASGNVCVTGSVSKAQSPSFQDILTLVYNSSGTLLKAQRYDGNYGGDGVKIKIDPVNPGQYLYVTGVIRNSNGNLDIVLIKYQTPNLQTVWAKRYNGGGDGYDRPYGLAADAIGNIYVVGQSQDYEEIPPGEEPIGQNTFITLKWDSDPGHPNPLWVQKYFGSGTQREASGQSIGLSGSSYVYVTGYARESGNQNFNWDYVTIKYSASGTQQWLRRYDNPYTLGLDQAYSLDISQGYIYVTGTSEEIAGLSRRKVATICYDEYGNQRWVNRYGYQYGPPADEGLVIKQFGSSTYVSGRSWYNNWDYITMRVAYEWPNIVSGSNENLNSVSLPTFDSGYAVGANGTILFTSNGGLNWSLQTSGTSNTLNDVSFVNSSTGTAVGDGGTILRLSGSGDEWVSQSSGTTSDLFSVHFVAIDEGTAVGANGTIIRTTDGGNTWESQAASSITTLNSVFFVNSSTGFVAGNEGTILKTVDAGANWQSQISGTINNLEGIFFATADVGFAVGQSGTILKTDNGGANWTDLSLSDPAINLTSVYFLDKERGIVAGDNGTILATTDAGETWEAEITYVSNNLKGLSFADDNTGIAVGENGAVLLTTFGEIFYDDAGRSSSMLKLRIGSSIQEKFILEQNFPNPFNPKTQIRYQVGETGLVKFSVYDVLGRLVSVLVNEVKKAGSYIIEFDGTNLSSGIYFYHLQAGDFSMTKKMVLLK